MGERENIRILMNGDKAKEIISWLLEDMLFDFHLGGWSISFWKTWPFIVILRKGE